MEEEDLALPTSTLKNNNVFHPSLPLTTKLITREEILQNAPGYENDLVLLTLDRKSKQWLPVLPDYDHTLKTMSGIVASGFPLRVLSSSVNGQGQSPSNNNNNAKPKENHELAGFRLEVPQAGCVTRVYLRHFRPKTKAKKPNNQNQNDNTIPEAIDSSDDEPAQEEIVINPTYRQAPFLLFVNDYLCVRHLPAHARLNISRKSATANKKTWERLELRAPFSSFYADMDMSLAEHQAAFLLCGGDHNKEIHWDEYKQRFVLMYKKARKRIAKKDKHEENNHQSRSMMLDKTESTTSSDEFQHHYKQRTWFALAKLDGRLDAGGGSGHGRVLDDDDDDAKRSLLEKGDKDNQESDFFDVCTSTACTIQQWLAPVTFFFLYVLSKLGIVNDSTKDEEVDNESTKVGADDRRSGGNEDKIPDVIPESKAKTEEITPSIRKETSPTMVDKVKQNPFVLVESKVIDRDTGELVSPTTVIRGTVRCETLVFEVKSAITCASTPEEATTSSSTVMIAAGKASIRVSAAIPSIMKTTTKKQQLVNLTRSVVTMKKIGFTYVNVGMDSIELGTFDVGKHEYELPHQEVPSTSLAKGLYKVQITYTAENLPEQILRKETVEFKIV